MLNKSSTIKTFDLYVDIGQIVKYNKINAKRQKDKEVLIMSMIADKIEKFILDKLMEEQERLILKRNELADELNCAPSQISYVLSTRFSNERGFDVESRRGLGGYIRIQKLAPVSSNTVPAVTTYRIYEGPNTVERLIDLQDVDQSLFQLLQGDKITRREAQMMHNSFATLIEHVDYESRNEAIRNLYASMIEILRKD